MKKIDNIDNSSYQRSYTLDNKQKKESQSNKSLDKINSNESLDKINVNEIKNVKSNYKIMDIVDINSKDTLKKQYCYQNYTTNKLSESQDIILDLKEQILINTNTKDIKQLTKHADLISDRFMEIERKFNELCKDGFEKRAEADVRVADKLSRLLNQYNQVSEKVEFIHDLLAENSEISFSNGKHIVKLIYSYDNKEVSAFVLDNNSCALIKPENVPKELQSIDNPRMFRSMIKDAYIKIKELDNGDIKFDIAQRLKGGMNLGEIVDIIKRIRNITSIAARGMHSVSTVLRSTGTRLNANANNIGGVSGAIGGRVVGMEIGVIGGPVGAVVGGIGGGIIGYKYMGKCSSEICEAIAVNLDTIAVGLQGIEDIINSMETNSCIVF